MIAALFCLLLPASGCSAYVQFAPSVTAIESNPARFDAKAVLVVGRVQALDQWHSPAGPYQYEHFQLCDGGRCVRVFMEEHSPIHNGDLVRVRGPYFRVYRSGKNAYSNEIEATEIAPLE